MRIVLVRLLQLLAVSFFVLVGTERLLAEPAPKPTSTAAPNLTPAEKMALENQKFQALQSLSQVLTLLETRHVDESAVKGDLLIEKAIRGMVSGLDPHTVYLPPKDLHEFQSDGRFGGIGVVISQANGYMEIVEIIPNSPASRSALKAGDIIYSIDGKAVTPENSDELLGKVRGLAGSEITFETVAGQAADIERYKTEFPTGKTKKVKTKSVALKREIIHVSSVSHNLLSDGYVYARISMFQEDTGEALDKALSTYENQFGGKLQGLILDLRNNPGGLFEQGVKVSDLFLDSGIIVSTVGRDKNNQSVEYASKRNDHPYMPMVVLVNDRTASASEIVAGALQDHNRAVILGGVTFGKGSVQQVIPLPNGAGIKITVARYYTPKGRSIQAKGIVPDIPLPGDEKAPQGNASRKEADLAGHIESKDLAQGLSADGFSSDVEKWPPRLRGDTQLRIAYSYVKSWERFRKN
jgi:carboxyl-terminal processing protease